MLTALWVRSDQTLDNISGPLPGIDAISFSFTSAYGRVVVATQNTPSPWKWNYHNAVLDDKSFGGRPKEPRRSFIYNRTEFGTAIQVPHSFLVLLAAEIALAPWRFRR